MTGRASVRSLIKVVSSIRGSLEAAVCSYYASIIVLLLGSVLFFTYIYLSWPEALLYLFVVFLEYSFVRGVFQGDSLPSE